MESGERRLQPGIGVVFHLTAVRRIRAACLQGARVAGPGGCPVTRRASSVVERHARQFFADGTFPKIVFPSVAKAGQPPPLRATVGVTRHPFQDKSNPDQQGRVTGRQHHLDVHGVHP